uniref:Uncharacterized protein n=1 Tax=Hypsizygus marmoreus TaxID=39966 RepID=A0A4P8D2S9_HYPMA|nr:hypothetical protein [Hypsizygus marmoreus]
MEERSEQAKELLMRCTRHFVIHEKYLKTPDKTTEKSELKLLLERSNVDFATEFEVFKRSNKDYFKTDPRFQELFDSQNKDLNNESTIESSSKTILDKKIITQMVEMRLINHLCFLV